MRVWMMPIVLEDDFAPILHSRTRDERMACISQIDAGLTSLRDLLPLFRHQQEERGKAFVQELILHSNFISVLDPPLLNMLGYLQILDLSSNQVILWLTDLFKYLSHVLKIDSMRTLGVLTGLVDLNLSNNAISKIEGLWNLKKLSRLILSFNKIKTLDGMVDLHGNHHSLKELDLKGNAIENLDELTFLIGCTNLKHLVLQSDLAMATSNPFLCDHKYSRHGVFNLLPQLQSLDTIDFHGNPCIDTTVTDLFIESASDSQLDSSSISLKVKDEKVDTDVSARLSQIESHLMNISHDSQNTKSLPHELIIGHITELEQKIERLQAGEISRYLKDEPPIDKSAIEKKVELLENLVRDLSSKKLNPEPSICAPEEMKEFLQWKTRRSDSPTLNKRTSSQEKGFKYDSTKSEDMTAENANPQKPLKKFIVRDKPTKETEIKMRANEKLIYALEQEEKRLLDNEQRYAEEIKRLLEELNSCKVHVETSTTQNLKDQSIIATLKDALEKEKKSSLALEERLSDSLGQVKHHSFEIEELKTKLENALLASNEQKELSSTLGSNLKEVEFELSQMRKTHSTLELKNHQLESRLTAVEDEKAKLSVRFLKERESFKVKMAEMKLELEYNRNDKTSLQKSLKRLEEENRSQDAKHYKVLEEFKSNHLSSIEHQVSIRLQSMMDQQRDELLDARSEAQNARMAYYQLEKDFKDRIDYESNKNATFNASYETLAKQYKNIEDKLIKSNQSISEHKQLIRELTDLAKDQKAQIRELNQKHLVTGAIFEEKTQEVDNHKREVMELKALNKDLRLKNNELSDSIESLMKAGETYNKENILLRQKIEDLLTVDCKSLAVARDKPILEENLRRALDTISKMEKQFQDSEQAIKIKNKMLDDQNESIKKLKQNLENKVRESSQSTTELSKREQVWQEQIDMERRTNLDLKAELETQENVIKHFQDIVHEYKEERSQLKEELAQVSDALTKRNESITLIEQEVNKVKEYFKKKEEKLLKDKDEALKSKDLEHLDMRLTFEAQKGKLALYEKERQGLVQRIHDQESELNGISQMKKRQLEAEVQILVRELDQQKVRMDEKISKIKAAFAE